MGCPHHANRVATAPDGVNALCTACEARLLVSPCCKGAWALPLGYDGESVGRRRKRALLVPVMSWCLECNRWHEHDSLARVLCELVIFLNGETAKRGSAA